MANTPCVKDRTKREHLGVVEKIIWSDADQPVTIMALADGHTVIIPANPAAFARGQVYRFLGRWEEGKRGPQFRASTYTHDKPHTQAAVVKYLSDQCSGIGTKTAMKLFAKYGSNTVTVLRDTPLQPIVDGILAENVARQAAEELSRFGAIEQTKIDLHGLLAGKGFPGRIVGQCISRWGVAAPDVISRDPYKLLTARMPGCGFKRCDKLYLENGGRRDSLKRQFLAGWNSLREDRSGSTWIDADAVVTAIRDACGPASDPIKALRLGIRAGWVQLIRDGSRRWLAERRSAKAEQQVADSVRRLVQSPSLWPTVDLKASSCDGDGLPSSHQLEQLRSACSTAVGCFTGGPGSGKTFTLAFLLEEICKRYGEFSVAVCAPTGKAAVRASESLAARGLAIRATTIHKLLEIGRAGHDGGGWDFQRNADNPLPYKFLIVDESSMIDVSLMASLLEACPLGTHVLFVGDTFQLPPVGHGAPVRDLIGSAVGSVGELTEIRRNAGTIVTCCAAIRDGREVVADSRLDLGADSPRNLLLVEESTNAVPQRIDDLLANMRTFDPVRETQVIVPLNEKSEISRKSLNIRLQRLLNPTGTTARGCPFRVGDKVICLRNSQLRTVVPVSAFGDPKMSECPGYYQPSGEEPSFVANGEQGLVVAVGEKECVFSFGDRLVVVPVKAVKSVDESNADGDEKQDAGGVMGDFDLAYAITVHKSQGSEWPCVIAAIDPAGGAVADRNFWYTAISRAKTACVLVGDWSAFVAQCGRKSLARRKTFLAELLDGSMPEGGR